MREYAVVAKLPESKLAVVAVSAEVLFVPVSLVRARL